MPQEIRRLVFSYAEVTDAIINYGKKYDIRFPVGQVTNVKFANESDIALQSAKEVKSSLNRTYNVQQKRQSVILSLFDSKTLEQKNFNLSADFVSGAIIEFCLDCGVMMPKKAKKNLDLSGINVCMDIILENPINKGGQIYLLDDDDET